MVHTTMRRSAAGALLAAMGLFFPASATAQETSQKVAPEPAPAPDAAATRFDGDWNLRMSCQAAAGAQASAVDMPASILNGKLFGSNGPQGAAGVVQVEGSVMPDGSGQLQARGRTGNPGTAAGNVPEGTPYSYELPVRFDASGNRGTAHHAEERPCDYTLTRR